MKQAHTQTPWAVRSEIELPYIDAYIQNPMTGESVCFVTNNERRNANANLIVRAVNAHSDLLYACESALEMIINPEFDDCPGNVACIESILIAAIKLAKGQK